MRARPWMTCARWKSFGVRGGRPDATPGRPDDGVRSAAAQGAPAGTRVLSNGMQFTVAGEHPLSGFCAGV